MKLWVIAADGVREVQGTVNWLSVWHSEGGVTKFDGHKWELNVLLWLTRTSWSGWETRSQDDPWLGLRPPRWHRRPGVQLHASWALSIPFLKDLTDLQLICTFLQKSYDLTGTQGLTWIRVSWLGLVSSDQDLFRLTWNLTGMCPQALVKRRLNAGET